MSRASELEHLHKLIAAGDRQAAADFALRLVERSPGDAETVGAGIDALLRSGDIQAALDVSKTAAREGGALHHFRHGRLLRETGQATAALEHLEAAQKEGYEPLTEVLLQQALAHSDLRQETRAIELLNRLLELQPGHQLARFNLASLYQAGGRSDEAERLFLRIFEQDPSFSEALVRVLYGRKMTIQDRHLLRRAEKRARSQVTSTLDRESLQFGLAKAYDDLGDYASAMAKARAANTMQAARIGRYDDGEMAALIEDMRQRVTGEWLAQAVDETGFEPIFIVGHFRSGSTLTEQVISGHPSTCSLGEVDFFLRLWFEDRTAFNALFSPGQDARLRELAARYRKLMETMGAGQRHPIDKRPENLLFMGLIRKLFPGARFVQTRRRLIDNAISVYFQQLNDLSRFGTSLESFHRYDRQCQELMALWSERFGESIHTIEYEDLVQSPEPTARGLLAFLELDWDPACLDIQSGRNYVRTASMAQVREGFHRRSVGRGRNYLPFLTEEERVCLETDTP